jgi:hypothetical protein
MRKHMTPNQHDLDMLHAKINLTDQSLNRLLESCKTRDTLNSIENTSNMKLCIIIFLMLSCARSYFIMNLADSFTVNVHVQAIIRLMGIVWLVKDIYDYRKETSNLDDMRKFDIQRMRELWT